MKREDIVWRTAHRAKATDFDINISCGGGANSTRTPWVRFGLLNRAKSALTATDYLLVSSVKAVPDRIYFMNANVNDDGAKKINSNSGTQVMFTIDDEEMDIFKKKWVGFHKLKFDMESQLHYIESGVKE